MRLLLKTFNLVPGEPAFSWDLSSEMYLQLVRNVNPMGIILVRWNSFRNSLKIFWPPYLQSAVCFVTRRDSVGSIGRFFFIFISFVMCRDESRHICEWATTHVCVVWTHESRHIYVSRTLYSTHMSWDKTHTSRHICVVIWESYCTYHMTHTSRHVYVSWTLYITHHIHVVWKKKKKL